MDRFIKKCEYLSFWALIFLVPANLSLNFFKKHASVYGITVDYLIPKLYLSDIFIAILLVIALIKQRKQIQKNLGSIKLFTTNKILLFFLSLTLFVGVIESNYPVAGYWYGIKIIEMIFLTHYIINNVNFSNYKAAFLSSLIFQSLVGMIQWIQKTSLFGYYFLGETSLKNTSIIAKTGITGEIRPLPYGTTPHPNVLAGFITIYVLCTLYIVLPEIKIRKHLKKINMPFIFQSLGVILGSFMVSTALLLTQSISALVALLTGIIFFTIKKIHMANVLAILAIAISLGLAVAPYIQETSISRRVQLNTISFEMISSNLWIGVGLNNFTGAMSQYGMVKSTTRFIQPVHNIYLLFVSEAGLIATTIIIILSLNYIQKNELQFNTSIIPLLALLVIGLADHYPISLQTGMLLSAFSFGLWLQNQKKAPVT